MSQSIPDDLFAQTINDMGAATLDQIESARAIQAESAKTGTLLTLGDVLIQQGVIPPALKENVEKKLQARQQGGVKQLGSYKLIKKLGEGGMGAVYLADDTNMKRRVAIKVLPKKYAGDPDFLSRFRREAKAAGRLNHANIISAFTVGEELGNHFYVMEYCEGEPLDKILKREQQLPWDWAIGITLQVARGLKHAHQNGIIHRDIKPANIFIASNPGSTLGKGSHGIAKILDMGLSKDIGGTEQSFNTQTGVALGTPHYISPEQAKGEKTVDGRTDIYSLGATLYHLVTGQTPFNGSTAAMIIMKHLTDQLPNPQDLRDDIPDGVVQVIQKMMAKEAADRYVDCDELITDLELVADGKTPSSLAIDVGKSSIAMARTRQEAAETLIDRRPTRKPAAQAELVRAGRQKPNERIDMDRRGIRAEAEPAPRDKKMYLVAGGVAALVLAGSFLMSAKQTAQQTVAVKEDPKPIAVPVVAPPPNPAPANPAPVNPYAKTTTAPPVPVAPVVEKKVEAIGNAEPAGQPVELFDQPGSNLFLPKGFKYQNVADIQQPMDIDFSDGRMWVTSRDGTVWAVALNSKQKMQIGKVSTDTGTERGLHGILCDPQFANNGFLYVFYTYTADKKTFTHRLSRFTISENGRGNNWLPNSEKVLLEYPNPTANHNGGSLKYNPVDRKIYLTTGDGSLPRETEKFFGDPKHQAQDLSDLRGKTLRLELDGSIPRDNPFVNKPGARGEIYTFGHRNPYSMNVDAQTGRVYVGEVGYDRRQDYEELNLLKPGGNFGWPLRAGPANGATAGASTLTDLVDPWMYFTREGGASICCGPIYRANGGPNAFPAAYQNAMFYADYTRKWVHVARVDPAKNVVTSTECFATGLNAGPLSLVQGPCGGLYIVEYPARVSRIVYQP